MLLIQELPCGIKYNCSIKLLVYSSLAIRFHLNLFSNVAHYQSKTINKTNGLVLQSF